MEDIVTSYMSCLETGNLDGMLKIFSENGKVLSPLRGEMGCRQFYRDLFRDSMSNKLTLIKLFKENSGESCAAHFRYDWVLGDGTPKSFEVFDVFEFDGKGKIKRLKIIYDPRGISEAYENLRK